MGFGIIKVINKQMHFVQMNELLLKKYEDPYTKLKLIFERTIELIDTYHPDEIAIEAPFYGKNVQSMLKLGRAQGGSHGGGAIAADSDHGVHAQKNKDGHHRKWKCQ